MAPPLLEVCVDSVAGVRAAHEGGAERVELCSALEVGGLTPSIGLVAEARAQVPTMPLYCMLRPRVGDFLYSDDEIRVMHRDLEALRQAGAAGIVVGLLDANGDVDVPHLRELVERARPLPVTFHRAFDLAHDPFAALEQLIEVGCARLLTSGQARNAEEGADMLSELVRRANGRISIMPGAGVRAENVARILRCGAGEIHGSGRAFQPTPMQCDRPAIRFLEPQDGEERRQRPYTDPARVKALHQAACAAAAELKP